MSLSDILPPVVKKAPLKATNNQNTKPKSVAYNVLTTAKSLRFVKARDKQYRELQKLAAPWDGLENNRKLSTSQNNRVNKPQPIVKGKAGMKCMSCEGDFGDETMLDSQINWVKCPNCKALHHYGCIKSCKECICGWEIRLQRKISEEVIIVLGAK